jgi:DNA polymerase III epsilon subunit-like protein
VTPGPQGLFIDIETSHLLLADYGIGRRDFRLQYDNVVSDWFMICASWQWVGGKRVYSTSLLDDEKRFKKDPHDDRHVVKALYDAVARADFLVGHNVAAFDWKKFYAKAMEYRLPPLARPVFVDTLKEARRVDFTSRKLADLCKKLGLRQKLDYPADMWLRILKGDAAAIREAVRYNRGDIPPLEDLYYFLKPYMQNHPNHNVWRGDGVDCCPRCGNTEIKKDGKKYNQTTVRQQWRCLDDDCRHVFLDGKTRLKSAKMR